MYTVERKRGAARRRRRRRRGGKNGTKNRRRTNTSMFAQVNVSTIHRHHSQVIVVRKTIGERDYRRDPGGSAKQDGIYPVINERSFIYGTGRVRPDVFVSGGTLSYSVTMTIPTEPEDSNFIYTRRVFGSTDGEAEPILLTGKRTII